MNGFFLLNKEKGITSNQLVQNIKKGLRLKKVGHLGTLDPMATGLMVIAVNRATKFSSYFLESDKSYYATIKLGSSTDTDDALGKIIETSNNLPTEENTHEALKSFIGKSFQIAPFYSALKHKGKPLYQYAREGDLILKPPREINVFSIKDFIFDHDECSFLIHCSKGTYIRSIARDLGKKLGCGAHLAGLKRVSQGKFNINDASIVEEVEIKNLISIEEAFKEFSAIKLQNDQLKIFLNGSKVKNINSEDNDYRIYDLSSAFLGLGNVSNNVLALKRLV
ncbi:tRNA pseudouridine(55) synthase TruB [Gammaproteobacteria bacterium]|jgi:tRNA pseudouridine55 synthase|nr:tRNA pseudouridine(55) synthase TruB [Gammaproteobacteria bacterium]